MKKINLLASAVLISAGLMFTSCWTSDDPVDNTPTEISGLETGDSYTLTVESNVKAKFTVGNLTYEGKSHKFEGLTSTDVTAIAEITADGYVTKKQEAKVTFNSEKSAATIKFQFMEKSTEEVDQATAKASGATVTNDAANQDVIDVIASITVPAGITITENTTDPFSITVFQPAAEGTESTVKTLAVSCTPDGAVFDKPVTLKLKIGTEYAGMTVKVKDPETDKLTSYTVDDDGYVIFKVNHFSIWDVLLEMTADTKKAGSETIIDQDVTVAAGTNTFSYTKKLGYETSENLPWFVAAWMNGTFGQLMTTTTLSTSFTADEASTVHLNIIQAYTDYGYKSGENSNIYNIRAWGDVTVTVTPQNGSSSSATSHSGGSGK